MLSWVLTESSASTPLTGPNTDHFNCCPEFSHRKHLVHYPRTLIGLKEILRVGGAFENDELFGLGSLFVLRADSGEAWAVAAGVVAGDDEERR